MFRKLILVVILISIVKFASSQSFLDAYKRFKGDEIRSNLKNGLGRKKLNAYLVSHIGELDTIFQSYRTKNEFDFNTADSIFIIYQAPVEAPFFNEIAIWSGKDTISYSETLAQNTTTIKNQKAIVYKPFRRSFNKIEGYVEINERDTLMLLTAKRDLKTAVKLANGQNMLDGVFTHIYVAYKMNGRYTIETCDIPPFYFPAIYRKK